MLSFKPTFSLFTFTFIKRLFSSSSLSAIKVVSSACLRLLIFLPAILIPPCFSSTPPFCMIYSAYKLKYFCAWSLEKCHAGGLWLGLKSLCALEQEGEPCLRLKAKRGVGQSCWNWQEVSARWDGRCCLAGCAGRAGAWPWAMAPRDVPSCLPPTQRQEA